MIDIYPPTLTKMEAEVGPSMLQRTEHGPFVNFRYPKDPPPGYAWNGINSWARGIVYDLRTKKPFSVPFSKFFNHGERNCRAEPKRAVLTEKIDGTCIVPYLLDGEIGCKTLGSWNNEHVKRALPLVEKTFSENKRLLVGWTFIFEFVHPPDGKYVVGTGLINYGSPALHLVGIRVHRDWKLMNFHDLIKWARVLGVEPIRVINLNSEEAIRLSLKEEWTETDGEGWVGIDPSGLMFKIKYLGFLRRSREKSQRAFSFREILRLFNDEPERAAGLFSLDDVNGAIGRETEILRNRLGDLRNRGLNLLPRDEKRKALSSVPKDLHSLIFCPDFKFEEILRSTAVGILDGRKIYEINLDFPANKRRHET